MKEFHMIVVDNDTKEIIGKVTDWHLYGLGISVHIKKNKKNGTVHSFEAENIDELLEKAKERNITIYYMIGGVRIPVNQITHNKSNYLNRIGWWNLSPAESVIFNSLWEASCTNKGRLSTEYLQDILTAFGFTPNILRMILVRLRKKLELSDTHYQVDNKNGLGYKLIDPVNDPINEFLMKESSNKSDYWILYKDDKLNSLVAHEIEHYMGRNNLRGSEILRGWQGLTKTESEIFFELVKFRNQWVSQEYLFTLHWATKNPKPIVKLKNLLKSFIHQIRRKIEKTDQKIETKYKKGYCLKS